MSFPVNCFVLEHFYLFSGHYTWEDLKTYLATLQILDSLFSRLVKFTSCLQPLS